MRKPLFFIALLLPFLPAARARAAAPALIGGIETSLTDDEKPLLAALLSHQDLDARFDAQAPTALKDTKARELFLTCWRAKMGAYAETDANIPNPDLAAPYSTIDQLLTPNMQAYFLRQMPLLDAGTRSFVFGSGGILDQVKADIKENKSLGMMSKMYVRKMMSIYRQHLSDYAATPAAQDAKRDAPAAENELARLLPGASAAAAPAALAGRTPGRHSLKPAVRTPYAMTASWPQLGAAGSAPVFIAGLRSALDQARKAAGDGKDATDADGGESAAAADGRAFDGGDVSEPAAGGGAVFARGTGARASGLAPAAPGSGPSTTAGVPSPSDGFSARIAAANARLKTKPADTIYKQLPLAAGIALGGLFGLLAAVLFAPAAVALAVGIGVAAGAAVGEIASKALFH